MNTLAVFTASRGHSSRRRIETSDEADRRDVAEKSSRGHSSRRRIETQDQGLAQGQFLKPLVGIPAEEGLKQSKLLDLNAITGVLSWAFQPKKD